MGARLDDAATILDARRPGGPPVRGGEDASGPSEGGAEPASLAPVPSPGLGAKAEGPASRRKLELEDAPQPPGGDAGGSEMAARVRDLELELAQRGKELEEALKVVSRQQSLLKAVERKGASVGPGTSQRAGNSNKPRPTLDLFK